MTPAPTWSHEARGGAAPTIAPLRHGARYTVGGYGLAPHQFLVRHAMRRVGIRALPPPQIRVVLLEVALELDDQLVVHGGRSDNFCGATTLAAASCSSDLVRGRFVTTAIA